MNQVSLIGNIGNAPKLGTTTNDVAWGCISVAINESWKDANGEKQERTSWIDVKAFNGLARSLTNLKKGAKVAVSGKLREEEYEKDGVTHRKHVIIASEIDFLTWGGKAAEEKAE